MLTGSPPTLRQRMAAPLAVAGATAVAAGVLLLADAADQRVVPPCPFLTVTGHWCPLCGGTRTVEALLHGDVAAAVGYNVLVAALVPLVAIGLTWWAVGALLGRNDGRLPQLNTRLLTAVVMVFSAFWVVRNLPGMELLTP